MTLMAKLENVFPGLCNDLHLTVPSDVNFFKLGDIFHLKNQKLKNKQKRKNKKKSNRAKEKNKQTKTQKNQYNKSVGLLKDCFQCFFSIFCAHLQIDKSLSLNKEN